MNRSALSLGIDKLYHQVIKPKKSETILILGDDSHNSFAVAKAFYIAGKRLSDHVNWIKEKPVSQALRSAPDIFFITNLYSDSDEKSAETWYPRKLQLEKKSRGFWFNVKSLPEFTKAINIDYQRLSRDSQKVVHTLKQARAVHISDHYGTNLTIDISDPRRSPVADCDGTQDKPGSGLNIPMGEVLISPVMGKTKGVAFIDLEFFDEFNVKTIKVDRPIKITFKNGLIDKIKGGTAAQRLKQIISRAEKLAPKDKPEQKRNCRAISEFAVGVNREICSHGKKPLFDLLFDEKIAGTAHIAFGSSYDGDEAPFHSDFIFSQPTVTLISGQGKKTICRGGKLVI